MTCVVCAERPRVGHLLCKQCGTAYDRGAFEECDVGTAIEWAARRARWFERRRKPGQAWARR